MVPQSRRRVDRRLGVVPLALFAAAVQRTSDVAEDRLSMVITGLVALAVVITVATVLYWRATRPESVADTAVAMHWTPPGQDASTSPSAAGERRPPAATFTPDPRAAEPAEPAR